MSEQDRQLLVQYRRLQTELAAVRFYAKRLPCDDMKRWEYSVRANEILSDLQALRSKLAVPVVSHTQQG